MSTVILKQGFLRCSGLCVVRSALAYYTRRFRFDFLCGKKYTVLYDVLASQRAVSMLSNNISLSRSLLLSEIYGLNNISLLILIAQIPYTCERKYKTHTGICRDVFYIWETSNDTLRKIVDAFEM